jgi:hypothetical protein
LRANRRSNSAVPNPISPDWFSHSPGHATVRTQKGERVRHVGVLMHSVADAQEPRARLVVNIYLSGDVMRYLAATLLALISAQAWANELDSLLQQAQVLGAPMAAVQRAIQISRQPIFPKKDVLAVFDVSQPSAKKRFYVLDFKSGQVTAHYAAHGRDNGPNARAIKFKGFQTDLDMVPLGPLKTAHSEVMDPYKTIVDRYDGTVYPDMIVVALEGVTSYNSYINHTPPFKWIIHPNWYTTAGFRAKNRGMLGRSNGCVVVDPVENNQLVTRLQDGALVYVTVGDAPIEQYL